MKKQSNTSQQQLRAIFFDFGGTLDSPGVHTRTLFYQALQSKFPPDDFHSAYTYADQTLFKSGAALGLNLLQ
ncbi:MAG: hypothetical protein HQK53_16610, partial [Oligoflexia bacterium]|nr:hypothetical protein [Oligoflexia bacterium]